MRPRQGPLRCAAALACEMPDQETRQVEMVRKARSGRVAKQLVADTAAAMRGSYVRQWRSQSQRRPNGATITGQEPACGCRSARGAAEVRSPRSYLPVS